MEQAQLFKRLYDMSMFEIHAYIESEERVDLAIMKLDLAARTRKILNSIQLEDMWQAPNEQEQEFNIYLSIKLSPDTLSGCLNLKQEMNCLEWRFVFPKIDDIPTDKKPKNFGQYIALMKNVEIINIEDYDIDLICHYLEMAYDFDKFRSPLSLTPSMQ